MSQHAAPVNAQLVGIDNCKTKHTPQHDPDLERQIVPNQFNRAGEFARLHHRTKPKNAVQNYRRRIYQLIGENRNRTLIRRIQQKTDYRQTARNIQHMRQQFRRIAAQRLAKLLPVLAELSYLAATLTESKEQAQGKRADDKPRRDANLNNNRTGNGTQAKTYRNNHAVKDHHPLQKKRIKHHQHNIPDNYSAKSAVERISACYRPCTADNRHHRRRFNANRTRRYRTMTLLWMQPVNAAIYYVVKYVNRRRSQAKTQKPPNRTANSGKNFVRRPGQLLTENKRSKNKNILSPVRRTHYP